ncbi:MAG TPA: hypothetical protein VHI52_22630, partial [Verrucomicrobiae bacterium]|nr:hypothetical protein [Verrucomicrobiae bacterium]
MRISGFFPRFIAGLLRALAVLVCCAATCALAASSVLIHVLRTPQNGLQPQVAVDSRGDVH